MHPSIDLRLIRPWHQRPITKTMVFLTALLGLAGGMLREQATAAFSLNWQRDYAAEGASFNSNLAYVACNMSYISDANCSTGGFGGDFNLNGSHDDGTAFLQEQLTLGGQLYFHVIVGDYTRDSMAQEVFIKASSGNQSFNGIRVSDSVANDSDQTYNMTHPYSSTSSSNGNGSANPNNVIMRQIINSGEISMEFLKDSFSQKPLITQTITNAEMVSTVSIDMRGRNYSQITPIDATSMTNTLTLIGATRAANEGNYDLQDQAQTSHISAGGFTYTNGSGNAGSGGTYTWYAPIDNFQPMNRNYQGYCNPSQNSDWSGDGACTNTTGGGGGGWGW